MSNDQIPKMQASQDDIELRQKQLQQRRLAAQRAAKAAQPSAVALAPAPKQTLAIVALIVAVGMGVFAGFLFTQLQSANSKLLAAEKILQGHSQNLAALNDKLSASDENANLSEGALKIMLKDHDGEIRKLWDLSNKTNKNNIAKNAKSVNGLGGQLKKTNTVVSSVNSAAKANSKEIVGLRSSIASTQKSLQKKLAAVQASVNGLPAATEKRISDNEQAIRSIDATRQKLNGSMSGVSSQFNEMKLEIEDIQIRLDRMQNAVMGTL